MLFPLQFYAWQKHGLYVRNKYIEHALVIMFYYEWKIFIELLTGGVYGRLIVDPYPEVLDDTEEDSS